MDFPPINGIDIGAGGAAVSMFIVYNNYGLYLGIIFICHTLHILHRVRCNGPEVEVQAKGGASLTFSSPRHKRGPARLNILAQAK